LPSVDLLLNTPQGNDLIFAFGRPLTLEALREVLEEARANFHLDNSVPDQETILTKTANRLDEWTAPTLQPVINATGVILHTNLGRAPLSQAAWQAVQQVSQGYCTLELFVGVRGSHCHTEDMIKTPIAEAALVVNNNAAGSCDFSALHGSARLLSPASAGRNRRVRVQK
jgi:L-seryl-tRNA(Ser) seleniumtransferase